MSDSGLSQVRSMSALLGPTQSCQQSWPHCRKMTGHLGAAQPVMDEGCQEAVKVVPTSPARTVLPCRVQCTCQLCCAAEKKYAFGNGDGVGWRGVHQCKGSQGQPPLGLHRQNENNGPGLLEVQPALPMRASWAPRVSAGTGFVIQY